MRALRRRAAILVALCVSGVAACVATPSPSASPGSDRSPSERPAHSSEEPSITASPPATPRTGLAAEIEVGHLDPTLTHPVLEFASDGHAILFSSGIAPDSGTEAAPDLWRFEPGIDTAPELIWRNPERDHSIVKLGGDRGITAFVEIPLTGERAWNLWLVPEPGSDAILLDTHPGDPDVSSLVPSFGVSEGVISWTAFDRGPTGPVSQLLYAEAPDWTPAVVLERPAAEGELWLPSLYGRTLVYSEVRYDEDRTSDVREVYLLQLGVPGEPVRLDASGRATMPVISDETVLWKEADPGFNMFNWGRMFRYDLETAEVSPVSIWPQEYVNYPSAGGRFVAWWGADAFQFGVYDIVRDEARLLESYPDGSELNVLRPHVAGDLLVWLYVDSSAPDAYSELRYAFLPNAGAER